MEIDAETQIVQYVALKPVMQPLERLDVLLVNMKPQGDRKRLRHLLVAQQVVPDDLEGRTPVGLYASSVVPLLIAVQRNLEFLVCDLQEIAEQLWRQQVAIRREPGIEVDAVLRATLYAWVPTSSTTGLASSGSPPNQESDSRRKEGARLEISRLSPLTTGACMRPILKSS